MTSHRPGPERAEARWERLLPGVATLRGYQAGWLRGDLLAGVTVAAYLVPQVMAYARVAGLPAVTGLWTVVPALVVYAVLGSSRQLSVGPESTTALMTAAGVAALVAAGAGAVDHGEVAALLAVAVGVICGVGYLLRLGLLAELLSKPVLTGYMAGIAVLMVVSQLDTITGLDVPSGSVISEVGYAVTHLPEVHLPTLGLAATTLLALVALHRAGPRWPGPLIVMLGAALAVHLLGRAGAGLALVGEVPRGLPTPQLPSLDSVQLWRLLPAALGVAVVAYSDNVLTARAFADRRGDGIEANQELLALGAANVAAGLFQGFPASSSGSRTAIADASGGRTQVHSLVSALLVVATLLWLGPLIGSFPTAALGGVVVFAAARLVDVAELRRLAGFRDSELVLAVATTVAVLVLGVLPGIGAAVALSVLDLLRRIVHAHDAVLGYVPGYAGMHDVDDHPQAVQVPGLVVYRYDAPLFFANAADFRTRALAALADAQSQGPVHWFLLNAEANTEVDLTAVDALESLRTALADQGVQLALARVKEDLRQPLERAGLIERIGPDLVFPTLPTAVLAYARWYEQQHGHAPPGLRIPEPPPDPTV
ncbi:SulP family inorganic anion transporter [Ornithinimicrobium tianjinense]|uniref:Sodium-independent anion transporter n=1 Tax=Ornithinimicrobium tianjinense TaxID=1195761 RepID=A0A917BWE9_9MICO|nr:SulP family inorganic anion transporter [Ornithinimicrobium tianjinense]GGF58779.1 sodium-independent anion transporter [Ornithinimicrobium tianjinense]